MAIDAPQIVYVEYGYFVLYVALILLALNSLLFATGRGGLLVHWPNNLLPELMYWPGLMTLLLGATLWVLW